MTQRSYEKSQALRDAAARVMPLGASSNFRYWSPTTSPVVARGEGCYYWDPDGVRYIDYRLGFGPMILGHAHPVVTERVREAIAGGTVFAALTELEVRVAERIVRMCPGVDMVRYANSGTEATMHAVRLARAYTGREKLVKFEGQYHGMHDYLLWSTASAEPDMLGPRDRPVPFQQSQGIPATIGDLILALPFNDFEVLDDTLRREWEQVAAIIVEPILGNAASIGPKEGWLELLRQRCDEYGIVLIFDEVKTGFRVAPGGAQELFGITADLVTYAKAMANGFPLAALGGKAEIMGRIGAGVAHGGTYCANVTAVAAADATLEILEDGQVLAGINAQGDKLKAGLSEILEDAGIAHQIQGPGGMFGIVLTEEGPPHDFRAFARHDADLYEHLAMELVERGVIPDPDAREPWFLCAAHDDQAIAETIEIFADAVSAVKHA
ncbi:MAG: aspartate aminotransferase family protein [Anaerolineae bacterium]|nr:aspartate aminotransferase family protein [Anaerolineae bacterium]